MKVVLTSLIPLAFFAAAAIPASGQSGGGFLYATGGSGVEAFTIDPSTGALTQVGFFRSAAGAHWVTTDPKGRFVYVANSSASNISVYSIDKTTGKLTLVLGAPYGAPWAPLAMAFDPAAGFAYATDGIDSDTGAGQILVYTFDGTGALKELPSSSPIPRGYVPNSMANAPTVRSLYVTGCQPGQEFDGCNDAPGVVFAFTIGPQGAPQPVPGSPFQVGAHPTSIAVDPQQQFLYVTNFESASLSAFSIDQSTGALTPVPGSPFVTDRLPSSVKLTGGGQFIYVGTDEGLIDGYAVNRSTGALTPIPGSPLSHQQSFVSNCGADTLAVDPSSRFLYAAPNNADNSFNLGCAWQIDGPTGALNFGSQVFQFDFPQSMITTAGPQ